MMGWGARIALSALGLAGVAAAAIAAGGWYFSAAGWRGPVTDHFDGTRFRNILPRNPVQLMRGASWWLTRERKPWTRSPDAAPGPRPPERVSGMRVTWVGHATVLLQQDGLNLLTDPMWSERASPLQFAGPRRVRPPGLRFEDLPPIDAVLLSHNHYDHMDVATLQRVVRVHKPRVFCGLGNRAFLESIGVPAHDVDWWEGADLAPGVRLTAVPAQHFSSRGLFDQDRTLWLGWVVQGPAGVSYFAGDTGDGPHFAMIRDRFGPPRLALLPIGAYLPEFIMKPVHISPAEAVKAHLAVGARTSVAIHHSTFDNLADEGQTQAPDELFRALDAAGIPRDRFWALDFGEGRDVPAPPQAHSP
jgi:L-ascorbate metabolism protein UlaG (beta-lactamase superfamily)